MTKKESKHLSKIAEENMVSISFRVSSEFKKKLKIAAAMHEITQSDLLLQAVDDWCRKNK